MSFGYLFGPSESYTQWAVQWACAALAVCLLGGVALGWSWGRIALFIAAIGAGSFYAMWRRMKQADNG